MARPKPAILFITLFLDVFGIGVIIPVLPKLVPGSSLAAGLTVV